MYSIIDNLETLKSEIQGKEYEGYIWISDSNTPIVANIVEKITMIESNSKFIIEGFIRCGVSSYSIKHVDGTHKIVKFDMEAIEGNSDYVKRSYVAHPRLQKEEVCFYELWESEKDPMCENGDVLQFKAMVFIGFSWDGAS